MPTSEQEINALKRQTRLAIGLRMNAGTASLEGATVLVKIAYGQTWPVEDATLRQMVGVNVFPYYVVRAQMVDRGMKGFECTLSLQRPRR